MHCTVPCFVLVLKYQIKTNKKMKKLFRIKGQESMLGGVMTGLSEYFEIDVTLLRVIAVGMFFTPLPIVIMYLIMWAVMPNKKYDHASIVVS